MTNNDAKIKVTLTTPEGEVLDTFFVTDAHYENSEAGRTSVAHAVREVVEMKYEVEDEE